MMERFLERPVLRRVIRLVYAVLACVIILSLGVLSQSQAASPKKDEKPKKAAEPKKAEDPKKKKLLSELTEPEKMKLMEEAKAALNNTAWDITLRISDSEQSAEESDKVTFVDNTVVSDKMKAEGFGASNYTIRLKGQTGEIVIWETMQTSEKSGIAFWRGEIRDENMRGVLSWHVDETKKVDYAFNSKGKGVAAPQPAVEEEKVVAPPAPPEEATVIKEGAVEGAVPAPAVEQAVPEPQKQ